MGAETPEQAEVRLLRVLARARFEVLDDAYVFEPLVPRGTPDPSALACVRDGETWSQLVPAAPSSSREGRFKMVSFHFAEDLDASGFVGWLAIHLKRTVGTGVIVICGKDGRGGASLLRASQGVFDYWGCPARLGDALVAEVRSLIERGRRPAES